MTQTRILWPATAFFGVGMGVLGMLSLWQGALGLELVLYMGAGVILWSLAEYGIHRFVNHSAEGPARINWDDHDYHHRCPEDLSEFVYELRFSGPLGVSSAAMGWLIAPGGGAGLGIAAGIWLGYLLYEWVHLFAHLPREGQPKWLWAWSAHHRHHHAERSATNYGFVTSLWDRVFGSYRARG